MGDLMEGREPQQHTSRPRTRMFDTRSQSWREVGLLRQISPRAIRRARVEALLLLPLFAAIVYLYDRYVTSHNAKLPKELGLPVTPIRLVAVVVLLVLGWVIARAVGRIFGPPLFRRLEPATAGTAGFLIRLFTLLGALVVALVIAGIKLQTLAVGGAVTAVIIGLAAQQTLGNVIAGTVMLSTRPFRVGDKIRLQGGYLGGPVDGVVGSLGLFYTTFEREEESILIPNSVVMNALVISGGQPPSEHPGPLLGWAGSQAAAAASWGGEPASQAGVQGSPVGQGADRPEPDGHASEGSSAPESAPERAQAGRSSSQSSS